MAVAVRRAMAWQAYRDYPPALLWQRLPLWVRQLLPPQLSDTCKLTEETTYESNYRLANLWAFIWLWPSYIGYEQPCPRA
ncbi:hypothetical protein ALT785_40006 [Alteromonas infernus]